MAPSLAPRPRPLYAEILTPAREDSVNRDRRAVFGDERRNDLNYFLRFSVARAPPRRFHGVSDQLRPEGDEHEIEDVVAGGRGGGVVPGGDRRGGRGNEGGARGGVREGGEGPEGRGARGG